MSDDLTGFVELRPGTIYPMRPAQTGKQHTLTIAAATIFTEHVTIYSLVEEKLKEEDK